MKPALLLYLKAFLFFSIGFGVLTFIADLLFLDTKSVMHYAYKGIGFGIILSLLLVSVHIGSIWFGGRKKLTAEILGVRHKRVVKSTLSQEALFDKLKNDPSVEYTDLAKKENHITCQTPWTIWSFGEKIRIDVLPSDLPLHDFEITSTPKRNWTILDYGKNLENVEHIEELIRG